jgi:hypothetical protein
LNILQNELVDMGRKFALMVAVVLVCAGFSLAQTEGAVVERPSIPADATPPVVVFSQSWPDAMPPYYSVAIESTGRTTYYSSPKSANSGDPYMLRFTLSPESQQRVFDLAKQLNHFQGNYDFKKSRIAYTGTKTLYFQNGKEEHQTSYNWSDNLAIQQLTKLFQDISETVEIGRVISEKYRFDKLGVDSEMKKLETASKDDRVAELQAIQPILSRIANDTGMMNITRRRAEALLAKIPPAARVNAQK